MFRHLFLVGMCMLLFSAGSKAQDEYKRHEFFVGYGFKTYTQFNYDDHIDYLPPYPPVHLYEPKAAGGFYAGYRYSVNRKLAIGIVLYYQKLKDGYAEGMMGLGFWKQSTAGILPELKYTYLQKPLFEVYGSAAAGVSTVKTQVDFVTNGGGYVTNKRLGSLWQVTPVGIRFGKVFGVYLEAGYGCKGIVNAGISIRT